MQHPQSTLPVGEIKQLVIISQSDTPVLNLTQYMCAHLHQHLHPHHIITTWKCTLSYHIIFNSCWSTMTNLHNMKYRVLQYIHIHVMGWEGSCCWPGLRYSLVQLSYSFHPCTSGEVVCSHQHQCCSHLHYVQPAPEGWRHVLACALMQHTSFACTCIMSGSLVTCIGVASQLFLMWALTCWPSSICRGEQTGYSENSHSTLPCHCVGVPLWGMHILYWVTLRSR